ncbi:MAG: hypothetical protein JXC36_00495 [Candidatus Atribacteria bacterium]|nr:hypothetical protein [Candidatus Atribacteria bacterium]
MRNVKMFMIVLIFFFSFISLPTFGQLQNKEEASMKNNWSSVDDVISAQERNMYVKKSSSNLIGIGSTAKEVQEVMGVPDWIDEEEHVFYYRQAPIYFDHEWKVQSWDNRYGNLNVIAEKVKIKLGSHIVEVFNEKGIPLRITRVEQSYQLEYCDELIYVGSSWHVEAIQPTSDISYKTDRNAMSLLEFIKEFHDYLASN